MEVKARKQGNSLVITIPSSFNIAEGTKFNPQLQGDTIIFKPIQAEAPRYIDQFDDLLIDDILNDGFTTGKEIAKEIERRKAAMDDELGEIMAQPAVEMSIEDFNREFGL
ncbi:AbrB/MazE/SpoVT family DNA-binding domain-containing protein [Hutsoniella sourekii]|uniref:AbrB/MazE/SpoVT family DNA-binding domain-containing protein n=1 Tax=Hutsoniella sourekii TaxID=87650 RepID=UPI0004AD3309|nr:hypothetical protein [Hutsoniella sourekii]